MSFKNIGFIGFGLIGGSIARAIKSVRPECTITVTSRSLTPLHRALNDGIIDNICDSPDNTFSKCDFIIICTPVITIASYLKQLKDIINPSCLISDVGSVKGFVHNAVKQLNLEKNFIGGHPMAGSELTGYANSSAEILNGAKYIITPTPFTTDSQLNALKDFIYEIKAEPIVMDAAAHDYAAAGISHVPHLSACALTHMVKKQDTSSHYMHIMAAGGFKDSTRIAASSPEMWEQICAANGDAISQMLSEYIDILNEIKNNIDSKTPGYIKNIFTESRDYRNTF
ncbi:MAG: prephenate dehydrogenase/arogenate dehydrogenase family protein [Eubacteriales bacterium]|nr:prephenate dehydrogenase/arogenate dehydrogenase family protein [Eubacteriales bacterium]